MLCNFRIGKRKRKKKTPNDPMIQHVTLSTGGLDSKDFRNSGDHAGNSHLSICLSILFHEEQFGNRGFSRGWCSLCDHSAGLSSS
jgi:hypothetical protein